MCCTSSPKIWWESCVLWSELDNNKCATHWLVLSLLFLCPTPAQHLVTAAPSYTLTPIGNVAPLAVWPSTCETSPLWHQSRGSVWLYGFTSMDPLARLPLTIFASTTVKSSLQQSAAPQITVTWCSLAGSCTALQKFELKHPLLVAWKYALSAMPGLP